MWQRCMFLDVTLHLAVKILVVSHFGGSKLEDLRPGYEISLYLTML